jgi:hypothetical protein
MSYLKFAASVLVGLLLVACSTVGIPTGPSTTVLDPLRDDVASLLIAFDLPRGIGPAKGSLFTFDVANGGPSEHLRLTPPQADIDEVPANLPPPGVDRAYYLFALTETDKFAIRQAQAAALSRGVTAKNVTLGMVPKLCTAGTVDPNLVTVSVLAVLPGKAPQAFLNRQLLSVLLQQPGSTQMPPCA